MRISTEPALYKKSIVCVESQAKIGLSTQSRKSRKDYKRWELWIVKEKKFNSLVDDMWLRNMNINDTLLDEINVNLLEKYGISNNSLNALDDFLKTPESFSNRQKKAIILIENIMKRHGDGKKNLFEYITLLTKVEYDSRKLAPRHRDHVVHAMLSFILGIYINENFLKPSIEPFQWKLASLFHDIGYPIEIAGSHLLRPFEVNNNNIRKSLGVENKNLHFKISMDGFEKLTNDENSFDLIDERLCDWHIDIHSKEVYNHMLESGQIDHGIISSLTLLNVLDLIYQKYNPERKDKKIENGVDSGRERFNRDVVSACSAIYIHNLKSEHFPQKINRSKAPLAFLLKLSDCLQEWERPSDKNPTGLSSDKFDIEFDETNKLIFRIDLLNDDKDKIGKKIRKEISCLDCPDVQIR